MHSKQSQGKSEKKGIQPNSLREIQNEVILTSVSPNQTSLLTVPLPVVCGLLRERP